MLYPLTGVNTDRNEFVPPILVPPPPAEFPGMGLIEKRAEDRLADVAERKEQREAEERAGEEQKGNVPLLPGPYCFGLDVALCQGLGRIPFLGGVGPRICQVTANFICLLIAIAILLVLLSVLITGFLSPEE